MGDAEVFARDCLVKVARKRLAGRIGNGVDDAVETVPGFPQPCKRCGNLFVVGDIAGEDQV